ncbi:MAG: glycosyltransferase family 39 protein, partial [Deltaproteobacteria bacterium]
HLFLLQDLAHLAHHVASGYSYLLKKDFSLDPTSPPLPRLLSAMPLWWIKARPPFDHPSWKEGNTPEFSRQFFYRYNSNADQLIFWARVPIVLLSIILGFAIFKFSQTLFGNRPAIFALTLYAFCPNILAHSGLATADLAVTLFFFMSLVGFWQYCQKPNKKWLTLTAIFVGLTFLSKYTAILLFPIFILIAMAHGYHEKNWTPIFPKRIIAFLFICFFTIWAGYFFETKPLLTHIPDPQEKIEIIKKIGGTPLLKIAEDLPLPLMTFASSFVSLLHRKSQGINSYLMGEWSRQGFWHYYFLAFAIKNTLPLVLLTILGIVFVAKQNLSFLSRTTLLAPILLFFLITLNDRAQAGIRYFLPIYPFCFLLSAGFSDFLYRKHLVFKIGIVALLGWHILSSLMVFPHYLSYFNEAIGGPKNGYKYLRDSNIDWGQDLKGLAVFVKENKIDEITLAYPWPADPTYYGIPFRKMPESEYKRPQKRIYAISAHIIDATQWAESKKPTAFIGYSIFVYDMRHESF